MNKEEFLQSTIDYFSADPNNRRCVSDNGIGCFYTPNKPTTEGCAIGRHLTREAQEEFDEIGTIITSVLGCDESPEDPDCPSEEYEQRKAMMPEWMQQMDPMFLQDVQTLHDTHVNWDIDGLTELGEKEVHRIIENNGLDESKLNLPWLKEVVC